MKILFLILIVIAITFTNVEAKSFAQRKVRLCIRRQTEIDRRGQGGGEIGNEEQKWLSNNKDGIIIGIVKAVDNTNLGANTKLYEVKQSSHRIDLQSNSNGEARIAYQIQGTVQSQAHLRYNSYANIPKQIRPSNGKIAATVYQALTDSSKDGYIYSVEMQQTELNQNGRHEYPIGECNWQVRQGRN
jgi:hypothetical protein